MKLLLIRGLPGSGKSTLASKLKGYKHFEADMFFIDTSGKYIYDRSRIKDSHEWCQRNTYTALTEGYSVVVSNTFTRLVEILPYVKIADSLSIPFEIIEVSGKWKNIHEVPKEVLKAMEVRWESTNDIVDRIAFIKLTRLD